MPCSGELRPSSSSNSRSRAHQHIVAQTRGAVAPLTLEPDDRAEAEGGGLGLCGREEAGGRAHRPEGPGVSRSPDP
jgi:hypothetical protein